MNSSAGGNAQPAGMGRLIAQLLRGWLANHPTESCRVQANGRWRVVGRDPDGDVLRVIVELHDDPLVITEVTNEEREAQVLPLR